MRKVLIYTLGAVTLALPYLVALVGMRGVS